MIDVEQKTTHVFFISLDTCTLLLGTSSEVRLRRRQQLVGVDLAAEGQVDGVLPVVGGHPVPQREREELGRHRASLWSTGNALQERARREQAEELALRLRLAVDRLEEAVELAQHQLLVQVAVEPPEDALHDEGRVVRPRGVAADVQLAADRAKLLAVRDRRPQPFRDDKVLTEWNGLAISSLANVYQVTGDAKYLEAAGRAASFILERMTKDGKLKRRFRHGEVVIDAFLEDYAALVEGLLDLYESDFQPRWLEEAVRLGEEMVQRFYDKQKGGFFSSSKAHEVLFLKTKNFYDGATPSGNSMAFRDLLRLHEFTGDKKFKTVLTQMQRVVSGQVAASLTGHSLMLCAMSYVFHETKEIVIAGPANDPLTQAMVKECHRRFLPAKVLLQVDSGKTAAKLSKLVPLLEGKSPLGGKPNGFVCRQVACKLPAKDLETFRKQLQEE